MLDLLERPVTICPPDPKLSMPMGYTAMPTRGHQKHLAAKFLPKTTPDMRITWVSTGEFIGALNQIRGFSRTVSIARFLRMIEEEPCRP